jgi:putative copper export protein/mono/diheme cytochrome c family protein/peroxiredoxin
VITAPAFIRFIHLASGAFLFGSLAFYFLVSRPALRSAGGEESPEFAAFSRRELRLARWTLLAVFVSGLLAFWLQIVSVSGVSLIQGLNPNVIAEVLVGTRYGQVWLVRMVLMLLLAAALYFRDKQQPAHLRSLGLVLAVALVTAPVFAGHAAAGEGVWLLAQLTMDGLHLVAASLWLGGLAVFALFLIWLARLDHGWREAVFRATTRRFSILGFASVVVLIVTGAFNAWILVGAVPPLVGTTYGKLLLVKLALLLPLIVIAAINLLKLKPRILALGTGRSTSSLRDLLARLKRNVTREAILGACILLIVGAMSVTPPARHIQPDWPFDFRWNWNALNGTAKIRSQIADARWLGIAGAIGLGFALLRRRPRFRLLGVSLATLGYGGWIAHNAVSIDAYPTTYLRPSVPYNVISVSNGAHFYQETCATCHGVGGYGDGPNGKGLKPRPADLTAKHSADHTAGDLFWWLSYGVKDKPMPGFAASLDEEERWDMINFLRALSAAERARQMSALVEPEPWLVAPDFVYGTLNGESRSLKDHRGNNLVMLVLFSLPDSRARLGELEQTFGQLQQKNVKVLLIPKEVSDMRQLESSIKSLSLVTDGSREAFDAYALFRRSFSEQGTLPDPPVPPHMEFIIDRQGYVRARWIPRDGPGWDKMENLLRDIDRLNQEKPSAPAPDDHVH